MRFLHTSDWHLGKRTDGRERTAEQREVLEEIREIAERERADVVLVAGDVYDTYMPSAEAEELFFDAAVKLAKDRMVVVVSGNHDDASRLTAPAPMAKAHNVYLFGDVNEPCVASAAGGRVRAVRAGKGFIVAENDKGERVYIAVCPYPTEARFKEEVKEDESFDDKMGRWLRAGLAANEEGLPTVLVGHFFVAGGQVSDSERPIDLGGARAVSKEVLPDCSYIALGHLHKRQTASRSKNAFYSGAILEYAFDEAGWEKSVNVFEINGGRTENFRQIPLTKGRKLMRLEADGYENALDVLEKNAQYYTELTLRLAEPLTDVQVKTIKSRFPDLLSLAFEFTEGEKRTESKKNMSDEELFAGYYAANYGKAPPAELMNLFLELINETDKT